MTMPFGLTNALTMFQSIMNNILWLYLDNFVIVYLDNIVIYFKMKKEYLEYDENFLKVLADHWLYTKLSKCIIGIKSLDFCGYVVGNSIVKPMVSKIKIIDKWPILKTVYEVRQFLELASYYWQFGKRFAQIVGPLFNLLKEGNMKIQKKKHWLIW